MSLSNNVLVSLVVICIALLILSSILKQFSNEMGNDKKSRISQIIEFWAIQNNLKKFFEQKSKHPNHYFLQIMKSYQSLNMDWD